MQRNNRNTDIVDIWREPENPRWKKANEELFHIFMWEAKKNYRIKRLPTEDQEEQVLALFHWFWIHCCENRTVLTARAIHGLGAVRIEIRRFLAICPLETAGSVRERFDKLLRHLRMFKLLPLLKTDHHFSCVDGKFWGLTSWNSLLPTQYFTGDDDALLALLPALPSKLQPQREGQLPPLVKLEDLRDFLLHIFPIIGRRRTLWDIANLTVKQLEPSPLSVFPHHDVSHNNDYQEYGVIEDQIEQAFDTEIWEQNVDIIAGQIVDAMPIKEQQVFALILQNTTQKEICSRLQISRSTVHKLHKSYQQRLAKFAEENQKTQDEILLLVEAMRDIVEQEAFDKGGI